MAKLRVFVLNGPNMNLLGTREPGVYGNMSYDQLIEQISFWTSELDIELGYAQTNSEGGIIDYIHASYGQFDFVVLNPGAFTHTSYALRDAIVSVGLPVIEVHLSNIYAREEWRAKSVISPVCVGTIAGLGVYGYRLALEAGKHFLSSASSDASNNVSATISVSDSRGNSAQHSAAQSAPVLSLSSAPTARTTQVRTPAAPSIVSVPVDNVDQGDLANLFVPTHKYEVANEGGNLGGNVGINEIQGFPEEGAVSVFAGNDPDGDEELSPEERAKLKEWMGEDYSEPSPEDYRLGGGITRTSDDVPTSASSGSYSSSEYPSVSTAANQFVASQQSVGKTVVPLSQSQASATKRLTIPIKIKK